MANVDENFEKNAHRIRSEGAKGRSVANWYLKQKVNLDKMYIISVTKADANINRLAAHPKL